MIESGVISRLLEQLREEHGELFAEFDPAASIDAFDSLPERNSYHSQPAAITLQWAEILTRFGPRGFAAFQKAVMLTLIGAFDTRAAGRSYTEDIVSRFEISYARILGSIQDPAFEHYSSLNDILFKDLALCRQKMFPCGAQLVEPQSAFHRAILYRGGLAQCFRVAKLLFATGGHWPWYQIHTHLSEREEFTPQGWDFCYLRIARMLEVHPQIKGMWGGSWFYDPALEVVSPRLAYLRTVPQQNGAQLYYSNDDIHGGALATSETRRQRYENGEYLPRSYTLLWPREAMINWARGFAEQHGV